MARIIAVTGKGGTGKTTIAALIIRHLKKHANGPILALDADPDANLSTLLGISVEKTIGDLREETLKEIKNFPAGMSKHNYIEAGLHQLIVETEKMDIITMGRSEGPGCYCYINSLLRKFADDLQTAYEWVVMDNEAGLEHLSRRTASHVDHLLVVVNDNPLAIDCARRIDDLISGLKNDIKHKHIIINNVDQQKIETVKQRIQDLNITCIGHLPNDPVLDEYIFNGRSLFELDKSPAIQKMDEIMEKIVTN